MTHQIIASITQALEGKPSSVKIEALGHEFEFKFLTFGEATSGKEALTDDEASLLSAMFDNSMSTLATALRSIDGVGIDEIFPQDKTSTLVQVKNFIKSLPETVVSAMWTDYFTAKEAHAKSLQDLPDFLTQTPSGE